MTLRPVESSHSLIAPHPIGVVRGFVGYQGWRLTCVDDSVGGGAVTRSVCSANMAGPRSHEIDQLLVEGGDRAPDTVVAAVHPVCARLWDARVHLAADARQLLTAASDHTAAPVAEREPAPVDEHQACSASYSKGQHPR